MNETMKVWRPKLSFLVTFPQAEIGLPSAPTKRGPEVEAEDLCGNTETAAPVSTRKFCFETESCRKMRPPRALSCPRRRPSFPHTCTCPSSSCTPSWSSRGSTQRRTHTSCVTSKVSCHLCVPVWGGGAVGVRLRGGDQATWRGDRGTVHGGRAKRSGPTLLPENLQ